MAYLFRSITYLPYGCMYICTCHLSLIHIKCLAHYLEHGEFLINSIWMTCYYLEFPDFSLYFITCGESSARYYLFSLYHSYVCEAVKPSVNPWDKPVNHYAVNHYADTIVLWIHLYLYLFDHFWNTCYYIIWLQSQDKHIHIRYCLLLICVCPGLRI